MLIPVAVLALCNCLGALVGVEGFVNQKNPTHASRCFENKSSSRSFPRFMSSYDIDSDGEAEQHIGEHSVEPIAETAVATAPVNGGASGRYDDLIAQVGLEGKLRHVGDLPPKRKVSCYDVFCNRELKQEKLAAVGFDMDYTLAQYKQPAFDKLAFDGAKEKLVHKLGYPEAVLDFEYDHEVRVFCR